VTRVLDPASAKRLALAVAALRVGLGLGAFAVPDVACRPWVGSNGEGPGRKVLARALGGRDVALGLGALVAARRGAPVRGWVEAAALADGGDVAATLASWSALPKVGRVLVLGAAAGAAAAGAVAARSL